MQDIHRKILINVEIVLLVVYGILVIASLVTGKFKLELLALPPLIVFGVVMFFAASMTSALTAATTIAPHPSWGYYLDKVPFIALGIYFVVLLFLPIASIIIFKRKYLIMNIGLLIGAAYTAYVFGEVFAHAIASV